MKNLNSKAHGYIDFALIATLFIAPNLLGLEGFPKQLSYFLGTVQTVLVFITAYPFGIFKLVPFQVHGALEVLVTLFMLAAPWIYDFSTALGARNYYLALALAVSVVWVMTDYRAVSISVKSRASLNVRARHVNA